MTKEDIIRMAADSGMELYGLGKDREKFLYYLERFAALVAAAEREECAKMVDDCLYIEELADAIRARGQDV